MTYNVFGGTLSLTQSINQSQYFLFPTFTYDFISPRDYHDYILMATSTISSVSFLLQSPKLLW